MPITSSAKKTLRSSLRKRSRNLYRKDSTKSLLKEIKKLVALGEHKKAENLLSKAYQALDKSVKTGIIKKNTAARKKSRLVALLRKTYK